MSEEAREEAKNVQLSSGPAPLRGAARSLHRSRIAANWLTVGLFVLAVLVALYNTRDFMIPVIAAILLNLVLSPIAKAMRRIYIPYPVSAVIILGVLVGLLAGAFYGLSDPVARWIADIPTAVHQFERQTIALRQPLESLKRATAEVRNITKNSDDSRTRTVVVEDQDLATRIFGSLSNMLLQMGLMLVLLFFLLSVGDLFLSKMIYLVPRLRDKLRAQHIAAQVVHDISIYLATITLINAALGAAIGMALSLLGLPNPVLWGVMAGLLNFVPYLGAVVGIVVVAIASFISFDTFSAAILPPVAYAAINSIEGQFITPGIVSRSLPLNPVVVFLSVSFWSWFWGIPGALMAVPILVIVKILGDHIDALSPIGEFLGGRHGPVPLPKEPAPRPQSAE